MYPILEKLIADIKKPFRVEIFVTNFKDGRRPEISYTDTLPEATTAIARSAAVAGTCFQYGKVFDESGMQVYEISLDEFAPFY